MSTTLRKVFPDSYLWYRVDNWEMNESETTHLNLDHVGGDWFLEKSEKNSQTEMSQCEENERCESRVSSDVATSCKSWKGKRKEEKKKRVWKRNKGYSEFECGCEREPVHSEDEFERLSLDSRSWIVRVQPPQELDTLQVHAFYHELAAAAHTTQTCARLRLRVAADTRGAPPRSREAHRLQLCHLQVHLLEVSPEAEETCAPEINM